MMRSSDRLVIATGVAVLLATFTVFPLTEDRAFLGSSWLLVILLALVSLGLRRLRCTAALVFAVQLLIGAGFVAYLASGWFFGGGTLFDQVRQLWAVGVKHMQTQAAPMTPNTGVTVIFVAVIGAIFIVCDLIVSALERPAWAIAPLAAVFAVPALGLSTDIGVRPLVMIAAGYVAILAADGLNTASRWTRGLISDSAAGLGEATPVVWRATAYLAIPALLLTVVLGAVTPTIDLPGAGFGPGRGGGGPLQLADPSLDLRRNLTQPEDQVVIEYQSDQPGGVYLRLATLPQFNANGWTNVKLERLQSSSTLGDIPGYTPPDPPLRTTKIKVDNFGAEYLPLPYAPRSFDAPEEWEWVWDPNSLIVFAGSVRNRGNAIRNLEYEVTSVDVAPPIDKLVDARAGTPLDASVTAAVPSDLPDSLIALTQQVTQDATTPALKAAAIQQFLRSSRYTYSTEPQPGSGYQALENFLLTDRLGYCEQFASAMAMMARVANIPSRVSIGFLPGERQGDVWQVSIRDMHAWPELYFAEYGWVRFEPTPASVTGQPPAWTIPSTNSETDPSAQPSAEPTLVVPTASSAPTQDPTRQQTGQETESVFPWGKTLAGSGIALLALLILAAPATIRVRRRSARLSESGLAEEQVEAAWAEIRDTVADFGGSWPDGSPKTIGREVARGLDQDESLQMTQVATLVERSRYARKASVGHPQEVTEMTQAIRRGIAERQPFSRKARAFLAPRSVLRRKRRT